MDTVFFTSFTGQKDLAFLNDVSSKREAYIWEARLRAALSRRCALANDEKLQCGRTIDGCCRTGRP